MKSQRKIIETILLLQQAFNEHELPIVTRSQWDHIPKTPFTVLISCILSLRTKDEITEQASIRLLKKYNTPEKFIKLKKKEIQSLIYPVGFYKIKAKRIKEISEKIMNEYQGQVPEDFEELLNLKGVGRKTG